MERRLAAVGALAVAFGILAGLVTSCGGGADEPHTIRLSVSNQSFAVDDFPAIEVFIDGNLALGGYFPVGEQFLGGVWITTDIRLHPGEHRLRARAAYSLEGQGQVGDLELVSDFAFDIDGDRWARLSFEFDPAVDETPRFSWVIDSEPLLLVE